ncbi:Protein NRT1/ PTR FAMILY 2.11 [Rhynchospora pubera]|uniref:Protein NRT1/ PTR FAMILY 2.11 n=1 Tax=Rhynchospora pubera TaxID=906938 RepID=A0AAV8DQE9_9POAL|nr:Protein NRT1/ PTR FAMILY 2.11 [Rhynchospora pubera]KAJ4782794.1 Protein NRT1/ PTR FAMILY 2.11 [Rhynchospora pubera]
MGEEVKLKEETEKMEKLEKMENGGSPSSPAVKYYGWRAMPYIIGNETFEKLGTLGTSSNLLVYLTSVFHIKSVDAATLINAFSGTTSFAPIIGAFLSDAYLGRYATLAYSSIASLVGMFILTLTAAVSGLHPHDCKVGDTCQKATAGQMAVLFASFAFLVVGAGGIRPCSMPFGADQFNPNTEDGKRGINSFFNWYYFTFTGAMMISATVIIYVQSTLSWSIGLAIPTILMFVACVFYFMGSKIYVKVLPEGSPFTSIVQVFAAATKKKGLKQPKDPNQDLFDPPHVSSLVTKLHHTDQFRFLDKAAIVTSSDEIKPNGFPVDPWKLCSIQQVEEVKCLLRIIPIWTTGIIYYLAVVQQSTYVILAALQSDRHLGPHFQIPAASFTVFAMLAQTLWIPFYDRLLVPRLRKLTGKEEPISLLQRMGIGILLSTVAMVVSAVVEVKRRSIANHGSTIGTMLGGGAISSMSSLWMVPQLMILGVSEAFNLISQIEFYYKEFPEHMRSVAGALAFLNLAFGNYLSGFLVTIIHKTTGAEGRKNWLSQDLNKGRLDMFYVVIAGIGVFNLIYFILCAKWYRFKGARQ